jgi:peroxiredoxin
MARFRGTASLDFTLTDTRGRQVRLSDYRGRLVVLVFNRGLQ